MALRKYYLGTHGPYYYDDADLINDPDGDFAGETRHGLITAGGVKVVGAPTDPDHVLRLSDMPGAGGGWTGWFDDGTHFRVTVVGGIITAVANSTGGGHNP